MSILPSRFCPSKFNDWTCSAARAGEECEATTEMTLSLQVDLVLNDAAATNDP